MTVSRQATRFPLEKGLNAEKIYIPKLTMRV